MLKTALGLPNSCSQCGNPITEGFWFAAHEDAARSGLGICVKDYKESLVASAVAGVQAIVEILPPAADDNEPDEPDAAESDAADKPKSRKHAQ